MEERRNESMSKDIILTTDYSRMEWIPFRPATRICNGHFA
jgi:hypothetical protein